MVTLITSSIAFLRTLLILGVSIGIDLFLLLQLPILSPSMTMAGLAVVSGLAVASGVTLVQYVETTLERSTPEELLTAYAESMTPEAYRQRAVTSRQNGSKLHPMHELHSVIMSGLSNGEWATAENGLLKFKNVSIRVIESLGKEGKLRRTDPVSGYYFEDPLKEYLPRIAAQALDDGESDTAHQTVRSMQEVGEAGLAHYFPLVLSPIASGLSRIMREAPDGDEGNSIRGECLGVYSTLTVQAAEQPAPSSVRTLLSLYAGQFRKLLGRDREPWLCRQYLNEFFQRTIAPAHKKTIEQYGQFIAESDIDWASKTQPRDTEGIAPYRLLFTYRQYSVDVIGYILDYYTRNEEWPMNLRTLQDVWTSLIIQTFGTGEYARAMCRSYIDLAYVVCQLEEEHRRDWATELAILQDNYPSQDCIDDAFRLALDKGITPAFEAETQRVTTANDERWFFNKIMDLPHPDMTEYEAWVREFKKSVDERRQPETG
jgi:hypothetical protein